MASLPRLLITGGSGFLGTHLVQQAEEDGRWETWALYFQHAPAHSGLADWRCVDLRDRAAVRGLVRQVRPAVIIHTAYGGPQDHDSAGATVVGSRNVAEAAADVHARLLHLSSDAVFDGEAPPYSDNDPPWPITPYGRAKAAAEWQVLAAGPSDHVIVRTSLIIGLSPPDPHLSWILKGLRCGEPITLFKDEYRCPIWVTDLAGALLELAGIDYRGILNVAGPQRVSRYELGEKVARHADLDPTGLTPGFTDKSNLLRPRDCTLDISRARRLLETPLRSLDEALELYGNVGLTWSERS